MPTTIAAALVAGLLGTPHCLGMCGGFVAACSRRRGGAWPWHAGRLATYTALGAIAGSAGAAIGGVGPRWLAPAVSAALLGWFALSLAGLVPAPALRVPGLTRAASRAGREEGMGWRVLFGAATGLLPCGMVYAALGIAVASGSAASGALTMLAFGIGTVPGLALMAVALQRFVSGAPWRRRALAGLVLATGLWTVWGRAQKGPSMPAGGHHEMRMPVR
ncbi:MAG TPA: sulfite exporter TauE/SafE family protein [Gemmatimonadaceae bacterium]